MQSAERNGIWYCRGIATNAHIVIRFVGEFQRLVDQPKTSKDAEIVRDLNRTYPGHIYYQQRQGPGQLSLYNVLKAYSAYDAKVHFGCSCSVCCYHRRDRGLHMSDVCR